MIGRELIERIAAEFHVSLDLCNDPEIVLKEGRCLIYGPDGRLWVWRPSNRPGLAVKELARKGACQEMEVGEEGTSKKGTRANHVLSALGRLREYLPVH